MVGRDVHRSEICQIDPRPVALAAVPKADLDLAREIIVNSPVLDFPITMVPLAGLAVMEVGIILHEIYFEIL